MRRRNYRYSTNPAMESFRYHSFQSRRTTLLIKRLSKHALDSALKQN